MKDEQKYYPMLAGISEKDIFSEESSLMWEKFNTMPIKIQKILKSDELTEFVYNIEKRYHFSDKQTEDFSVLVRKYFFREISENEFAQKVSQMCHSTTDDAIKLFRVILAIEPKEELEENKDVSLKRNTVQISFTNALANYPKVKEQFITEQPIIAKPFLQPLKPTLKNWIMVYEKILDVSRHNTIERGDFVFRAEATNGLTHSERADLAHILRARDEDGQITIDRDTSEIVFEEQGDDMQNKPVNESRNIVSGRQSIIVPRANLQQKMTQVSNDSENIPQRNTMSQTVYSQNSVSKRMDMPAQQKVAQKPVERKNFGIINESSSISTSKKDPNEKQNPVFTSVQDEIIKNRMEMQKKNQPTQVMTVEEPQVVSQDVRPIGTPIQGILVHKKEDVQSATNAQPISSVTTPTKKVIDEKPLSFVAGEINFSSNHTLPSEMPQKKLSANYLNISPIGVTHVMKKNKKQNKSM